jgi:hypothetical protein
MGLGADWQPLEPEAVSTPDLAWAAAGGAAPQLGTADDWRQASSAYFAQEFRMADAMGSTRASSLVPATPDGAQDRRDAWKVTHDVFGSRRAARRRLPAALPDEADLA